MLFLLEFFSLIIVCLSFFITCSSNPIYAIIFLILVFCNAGCSLFFYNFDFFGLIFIIIYVGAIAVLFLFIIMMLSVKLKDNNFTKENNNFFSTVFILFFSLILGIYVGSFLESCIYDEFFDFISLKNNDIFFFIDPSYNIVVFGQYFYNFFNIFFILAGIILLVALVGAVTLTLDSSSSTFSALKQIESKQLAKSSNILSFL